MTFEELAFPEGYNLLRDSNGIYLDGETVSAEAAWLASRNAALDEAIKAVEGERLVDQTGHDDDRAYNAAIEHAGEAILALKEE